MKSQIVKILILTVLLAIGKRSFAFEEVILTNPAETALIWESEAAISKVQGETVAKKGELSALMTAMTWMHGEISKWENAKTNYYMRVEGFAEQLKASKTIYHEALKIIAGCVELGKTVSKKKNIEGIAVSLVMDQVYFDVAVDLVSVYSVLKESVGEGGSNNMLNGAERTELLWQIQDKLTSLRKHIYQMCVSLRYYKTKDFLNKVVEPYVRMTPQQICEQQRERWSRWAEASYSVDGMGEKNSKTSSFQRIDR